MLGERRWEKKMKKQKRLDVICLSFFGFYMNNVEDYEDQEEELERRRTEGKKIRYEWFTVTYHVPAIKRL